jgi:hypothetical protein
MQSFIKTNSNITPASLGVSGTAEKDKLVECECAIIKRLKFAGASAKVTVADDRIVSLRTRCSRRRARAPRTEGT